MNNNTEVVYLYLDDIIPNRFQPREVFDEEALKELAISIREHGVIQPIIVRQVENKYEIIAGERRYKASTMAGLTKIPAIIKNLDDKESSKVALIENLQRRNLTPIEEARTYQKILDLEEGMTHEQLAATMGKTRSSVSNKLRLLALPDEIQDALMKEKITERHARSLLSVDDKNTQIKLLDRIIVDKLTVRELEEEVKKMNNMFGNDQMNSMPNGLPSNVNPSMMGGFGTNDQMINVGNIDNNNMSIFGSNNSSTQNIPSLDIVPGSGVTPNNNSNPISGLEENNVQNPVDAMMNVNNNPANSFNPTVVDVNAIRENAVDINQPVNHSMDINSLMKDSSSDQNFKFVPSAEDSFGIDNSANNINVPASNPSDFFGGFGVNQQSNNVDSSIGNTNSNSSFFGDFGVSNNSNSNIPSTMPGNQFNMGSFGASKKDVSPAINDIKSLISALQLKGFTVTFNENDNVNDYQINIKIDKN